MATSPLAPGWKRLPGQNTRQYINEKSGEILSRRQYDKRFGRLAGTGLTNESLAKKNKEENPLASALRPARGRKKLDELKQYQKQIKKNARDLQDTDYYITEFLVEPPTEYNIATALAAISSIRNAVGYRRVLTYVLDDGSEIVTSTPYKRIPKASNAIVSEIEELDEFISAYKFGENSYLKSVLYIIRVRK